MASYSDIESAAPDLAQRVRGRFEAHGLGVLATLRRDGAPRVSGIEPLFALGELWLGMMPDSRKAIDAHRDPRFALHSASIDTKVLEGDAKVAGRLVPVDDEATVASYLEAFAEVTGYPTPPGPFPLFRADVTELSFLRPDEDHLDIDIWTEAGGARHIDRY